jgi:hypothetical protein
MHHVCKVKYSKRLPKAPLTRDARCGRSPAHAPAELGLCHCWRRPETSAQCKCPALPPWGAAGGLSGAAAAAGRPASSSCLISTDIGRWMCGWLMQREHLTGSPSNSPRESLRLTSPSDVTNVITCPWWHARVDTWSAVHGHGQHQRWQCIVAYPLYHALRVTFSGFAALRSQSGLRYEACSKIT